MTRITSACSLKKNPAFAQTEHPPGPPYRMAYGFRCCEPFSGKRAKILYFADGTLSSSMVNLQPAEYAAYCMARDLVASAASEENFNFIARLFMVLGDFEVWRLDPAGGWRAVSFPGRQGEP